MRCFHRLPFAVLVLAGCNTDAEPPPATPAFVQAASPEEAGHYLFLVGGCNDCHTAGWSDSKGKLPEADWAMGNPVGYHGPWGTTYAANLRISAAEMSEHDWVQTFRQSAGLPPMPWQNYVNATESDLVAIQRFLRSLGKRGAPAPAPLPAGKQPTTPYVDFTPRTPSPLGP